MHRFVWFFSRLCLWSVSHVINSEFQHNFLSHWTFCDWEMRSELKVKTNTLTQTHSFSHMDEHPHPPGHTCFTDWFHAPWGPGEVRRGLSVEVRMNEAQSQPDTQAYQTKGCIKTGCEMRTVNTFLHQPTSTFFISADMSSPLFLMREHFSNLSWWVFWFDLAVRSLYCSMFV